ncbi:hypothetical protein HKX48_008521 [Thoreauomyces humboldtii]|nr:hypothetical protein HKX48_008521 [Thoreauomyces humboldtii]
MHVPQLPSLLPPLLCILALLPDTYSTATVPTADWNDPTLDYCAANILVVNSTSPPCKTQQTLARLPETNSYTIGDTSIVYMKFLTYDVIDRTLNYTSTGVFYPLVDDYSELTIPNSFSTLTTNTTDTTHGPLIGMELLYANTTQATDYLKWAVKEDGEYLSVTSRTAVVTLDNGRKPAHALA